MKSVNTKILIRFIVDLILFFHVYCSIFRLLCTLLSCVFNASAVFIVLRILSTLIVPYILNHYIQTDVAKYACCFSVFVPYSVVFVRMKYAYYIFALLEIVYIYFIYDMFIFSLITHFIFIYILWANLFNPPFWEIPMEKSDEH